MEAFENESRMAALLPEEGALKPALPRSGAGGAALRTMLRNAERMNGARLYAEVSVGAAEETPPLPPEAGSCAVEGVAEGPEHRGGIAVGGGFAGEIAVVPHIGTLDTGDPGKFRIQRKLPEPLLPPLTVEQFRRFLLLRG